MGCLHLAPILLALAAAAAGQSQLTQLTTSGRQHKDAVLNAAGTAVAFAEGRTALGVVTLPLASERIVYTSPGAGLNGFVWEPLGSALFFVDNDEIKTVGAIGGIPLTLASGLPGTNLAVHCVDSTNTFLYASRQQAGSAVLFRLRTNGSGVPQNLATLPGLIDEVRIDATDSFLLLRNGSGLPFTPVDYLRFDLNALGAPTPMLVGNNDIAQSAHWLDAGQNFVLTARTALSAQLHLNRATQQGAVLPFTDVFRFHRRSFVRAGGSWIVCELLSPDSQGVSVGLLPLDGGGMVLLDVGRTLYLNSGSLTGGLSIDAAGTIVALCAGTTPTDPHPQIYTVALQREIRLHPRVQTGQSFQLELPAAAGELGVVAAGFALHPTGVQLPPLQGTFRLDPAGIVTLLSGAGTGAGPITTTLAVPATSGLVDVQLLFQGVRLDAALQGGFTHAGFCHIF